MFEIKKFFKLLSRTIMMGLLASLFWLQGFWTASVQAMPTLDSPHTYTQNRILDDESAKQAFSDRYQTVLDCIPSELGNVNNDVQERIQRALSELGNDQLERAFDLTDNPALSEAEIAFEQCLDRNGFIPQRQLQTFLTDINSNR